MPCRCLLVLAQLAFLPARQLVRVVQHRLRLVKLVPRLQQHLLRLERLLLLLRRVKLLPLLLRLERLLPVALLQLGLQMLNQGCHGRTPHNLFLKMTQFNCGRERTSLKMFLASERQKKLLDLKPRPEKLKAEK